MLYRPVLSMPPVILMGGGPIVAPSNGFNNFVQSPIIEMPPSPAPNQIVEFPEDDEYIEVRYEKNLKF